MEFPARHIPVPNLQYHHYANGSSYFAETMCEREETNKEFLVLAVTLLMILTVVLSTTLAKIC